MWPESNASGDTFVKEGEGQARLCLLHMCKDTSAMLRVGSKADSGSWMADSGQSLSLLYPGTLPQSGETGVSVAFAGPGLLNSPAGSPVAGQSPVLASCWFLLSCVQWGDSDICFPLSLRLESGGAVGFLGALGDDALRTWPCFLLHFAALKSECRSVCSVLSP